MSEFLILNAANATHRIKKQFGNVRKRKEGEMTKIQISRNFKVSDSMRKWAKEKAMPDPDKEVEGFIDYWLGTGDKMADWEAVFRNRLRQVKKWGNKSSRPTPTVNPTADRNQEDMNPEEREKMAGKISSLVSDLAKTKNVRET